MQHILSEILATEFSDKNDMINQIETTMCLTFKCVIPHNLTSRLEELYNASLIVTRCMLEDRTKTSSKFYKEIPCVLAKSLSSKYQRNKKLKSIKSLVLPVCGDKGKQVKMESGGIRVPAFFKKQVISCVFPKPVIGFIRQVEFFKRSSIWYMSYSYNVSKNTDIITNSCIGVDRNSVGNTATIADLETGKVRKLGISTADVSKTFRNRRAKLQRQNKKRALCKLSKKQARRTKDNNHKVSRSIVNYAKLHCKAIALEKLGKIAKKGKAKRYVQKSQWPFYQLETFIRYKASLLGIPVIEVNPRNTSKKCSRCGEIGNPNRKSFVCKNCGHVDHRDSNAAFNIASLGNLALEQRGSSVGLTGNPLNLEVEANATC